MTNTIDFITELFCKVDDNVDGKHPQSKLYHSEVVTLGLLYALKGCGQNSFWRRLTRNTWQSTLSCLNGRIISNESITIF